MKTSENIDQLAAALATAQGQFQVPKKTIDVKVLTKSGSHYTFSYAPLSEIISCTRKALSDNGVAYVQSPSIDEHGNVLVTTRICHASGQWIEDALQMRPDTYDPQKIGSTVKYIRRYQLSSMLGLDAETDDDANIACGNDFTLANKQAKTKPATNGPVDWKHKITAATTEADLAKVVQELAKQPQEVRAAMKSVYVQHRDSLRS